MSKSEAALTAGSCQDTGLRTNSLWPASPLSDAAPPSVSQGIHIPKNSERSRASKDIAAIKASMTASQATMERELRHFRDQQVTHDRR